MKKFTLIILVLMVKTMTAMAQQLPVLRVTFDGSFSKDMDYIQGNMSLTDTDGSVINLPAKFKTRGATALNYSMKPSFNMKLRETDGTEIDSTLCGLRSCSSWILDAMAIDRICMRNRVAFDVWNAFSHLPYDTDFDSRNGTVGKFLEVYINGEYKGIYCLTDRINRKLLNLKKTDVHEDSTFTVRGVLYKQGTTDIADQSTPGFFNDYSVCVVRWHDAWELTEPEDYACEEAWQPLLDAYDSLTNYNYVKKKFYLDNIADYILLIMDMSITDNWGNKNKYISARNIQDDGDKARFIYTPWDLDTSLGGNYDGSYYDGTYSDWQISDIVNSAVAPFSTVLQQTEFKNLLLEKWRKARVGSMSVDSVSQRLRDYRDLFINSGAWARQSTYFDALKDKPCYVEDLSKEIDYIIAWYKNRVAEMDAYFGITSDGIRSLETSSESENTKNPAVYDLFGRKVADRFNTSLPSGLYIVNGKKVVK